MSIRNRSAGEKVFDTANVLMLTLLSLAFVIPFLSVLSTSFISAEESLKRGAFVLIPHQISLDAYSMLLHRGTIILNAYQITLFRVIVGTLLSLSFTASLAYGLARRTLPGRNIWVLFIFITMIFHGGLVPQYMLFNFLGLKNSIWVLVIPGMISAWNLFIMRNFFLALPTEIEESAVVDGAKPAQILWKIVIPLSMPAMATIGLFYSVYFWNEWFSASIYIDDAQKLPIQVIMRNILQAGTITDENIEFIEHPPPADTIKSAIVIISTVPILFVYPFIQRYFVKGVLIGSVKG
ncbi:carbohydrate ABC transporter permease [Paenibacillus thalictri]|uniref:Carbohydrate ABC transporter permease n=1 Tax=Paenibacillus thalictri TaxID=2527873 RepID=A0A4V2J4B6_9BACL|nr:carbohydrate ABC transporter permease [Paenibacillus thalictri]TBL78982.1 carbohydrate ABC transporter permease [Paenibacillus thalictri]